MRSRVLTLSWFGCFVLRSLLLLSIVAIPDAALGQCVDWHDYLHLRGRYWQHGVSFDMDVEGTFLYSANANSGMYVFDISDPDRVLLADFESVTFAVGIEVDSGYAYVAKSVRSRYGILVFDVRNPYDVRQVGGFEVASQITTLSIEGHVLYVGYGGGIWIYDLFDPATPKLLGCVEVLAYQVTVSNGLAAAVSDNKVSLVDVSDPELPV
ncbi:MAG: hypothetical protein R3E12_14535, partial [Candidatus Eisenbacteria bacterium]